MEDHPLMAKLREALETGSDPERILERVNQELMRPQLWGASEVADKLGVSHGNMYKIHGLPEPRLVLQRGRLWSAYEVKELARKRRRERASQ